jgi:hypothetical protein
MVANATPRWTGARLPIPDATPRPGPVVDSRFAPLRPLAVHAVDEGVPEGRLDEVLDALETARVALDAGGWLPPPDDGGRGGRSGFDLYLVAGAPAEGRLDGMYRPSHLDRGITYAVLDPFVARGALLACATMAYADALLLALDPAEALAWRRATAAWLAHRVSGQYGCLGRPVVHQQTHPGEALIDPGPPDRGAGGALLVGLLSDRLATPDGRYLRDVWDASRQLTWQPEAGGLRAWPDLWHALEATVEPQGLRLPQLLEGFAVDRWAAGRPLRAPSPTIAELGPEARVPAAGHYRYGGRAFEVPGPEPGLHPTGSAYLLFDVAAAPRDVPLGFWLQGEVGVDWGMTALRLDATGHELGRMSAPIRREPRAYLPVVPDRETRQVLVVVTNLGEGLPDATRVDDDFLRSFRLRVGRPDG